MADSAMVSAIFVHKKSRTFILDFHGEFLNIPIIESVNDLDAHHFVKFWTNVQSEVAKSSEVFDSQKWS